MLGSCNEASGVLRCILCARKRSWSFCSSSLRLISCVSTRMPAQSKGTPPADKVDTWLFFCLFGRVQSSSSIVINYECLRCFFFDPLLSSKWACMQCVFHQMKVVAWDAKNERKEELLMNMRVDVLHFLHFCWRSKVRLRRHDSTRLSVTSNLKCFLETFLCSSIC